MSIVSDRHSIVPFVAGTTKAMNNQRLAKVGYKTTKKQAAKYRNIAVSVPMIDMEIVKDRFSDLEVYFREYLESAQDAVIRKLYEAKNGTLDAVSDSEIGISAIINHLAIEASGERLKKEFLESWFDENVKENLSVLVAEKLGFDELTADNMKVIDQHVNAYRGLVSGLSGGATFYQPKQIAGIRKALEVSAEEDEIVKKLSARLDVMEKKENIADLLGLD